MPLPVTVEQTAIIAHKIANQITVSSMSEPVNARYIFWPEKMTENRVMNVIINRSIPNAKTLNPRNLPVLYRGPLFADTFSPFF
jgi:hypothetical protein